MFWSPKLWQNLISWAWIMLMSIKMIISFKKNVNYISINLGQKKKWKTKVHNTPNIPESQSTFSYPETLIIPTFIKKIDYIILPVLEFHISINYVVFHVWLPLVNTAPLQCIHVAAQQWDYHFFSHIASHYRSLPYFLSNQKNFISTRQPQYKEQENSAEPQNLCFSHYIIPK